LGVPPQRLLDLCDKYGLLVQYEWSFFHGMPASTESLMEQYPAWFNLAMCHPCVANYHPYNETEGDQLKIVWKALDKIVLDYPPLVMEERDVIHVHKYWWSLFENVGIYYDDADQFDKAIMVDEFGGNYLDEKGNLGGYKSLKESFLRFLGRTNTVEERLKFQSVSAARVGEYWRRIGAAGVAPFVIASSWEDGNTWFMGDLKDGKPKPIWDALTALYSPQSVSLDLWDTNFKPGQKVTIPLFFFNDAKKDTSLVAMVWFEDKAGKIYNEETVQTQIKAFQHLSKEISVVMPSFEGQFTLKAILINVNIVLSKSIEPQNTLTKSDLYNDPVSNNYSISSSWDIRTFVPKICKNLKNTSIAIAENEPELIKMFASNGIPVADINDKNVKLLIGSLNTWQRIANCDLNTKKLIENTIQKGISVVLLDIGERNLGQGYPLKKGDLGNLQGLAKVENPKISQFEIFDGISLICTEAPEPESHLHAAIDNNVLWKNLPKEYSWLWNGMRGGLIVPSSEIEVSGLSQSSFLEQWKARGADIEKIKSGNYYAYDLQGFYQFSTVEKDQIAEKKLRDYVSFLVEDAPALASSINPLTPIRSTNLSLEYKKSIQGKAQQFKVLANAGKNLTRTPVLMVDFGKNKGKLLLSQLLTAGRLHPDFQENTKYGIRNDEVAVQMVLNMMSTAIERDSTTTLLSNK
jgi:beta-galactosidase